MNADGSGAQPLFTDGFQDGLPAWSPDGSVIAFWSNRGGSSGDVWLINPDGSGLVNVTGATSAATNQFSWTPDGQRILYTERLGGSTQIMVIGRDGSGRVQLTNTSTSDADPVASPDGSQILFVTERDGVPGKWQIYSMGIDGSSPSAVTSDFTMTHNCLDWRR